MLLKISLIFSLIGLVLLYFLSGIIEPRDYNPSMLNFEIGEFVKAKGFVSKVSGGKNTMFIELNQYSPVEIVVFNVDNLDLKEGDEVEVIGKTEEYKGEPEIIASRIRKISEK